MNKYIIPTLLLLINVKTFGQTGDFDRTYQIKTIYNQATQTSTSDSSKVNQMIIYSGIYGRTEQTKILNYAPDGSVLIQPTIYDEYGNINKNYLPYTHTSGAAYDNNVITNQGKFYQNTPLVAHDDYPYTSVEYDKSPSNFIRSGKAVGTFWQNAANPTNKLDAQKITNTVFDVYDVSLSGNMYAIRKWDATVSNGYYAPNELSGYVSSSPEHATEVTFSDKSGRIICKRTLNTAANKLLTTFYVYNDLGKLIYVIPPKAYYQLELAGVFDITLLSEDLIFKYTYDEKGRLIEKKIPGKDKIEVVYDNLNRVILQQDGNLRTQNKWFLYRYDAINRPLIVGTYVNNSITSRAAMQSAADAYYSSGANSEVRDGTNFSVFMGYSNQSFPLLTTSPVNFEILTVNYYDDYDFNSDGTDDVSYIQHIQEHNPAFNNKNRLTKTKSKKIGGTGYLSEVYFYQFNTGELIQTQSDNSLGGLDLTNYESNFLGQPVRIEHHKNYGGLDYHFIKNRYTYDHQNRLIKSYEQIDNDPEIVLSEYAYNHLGQPIIKKLHSENDNGSYLQNINYSYHINGGVTKINNATTLGILDPIELIATFSSNAVIDIVYTSDATFLGNVDLAKYITTVGIENYQFRIDEWYIRGGGKYLELSYTDNKEFTINSDLSLPTPETAIVTSTESYKERLLTYVSGSLLYDELQKLNMATIDIAFTDPITDFTATTFYDNSRAQIATQLANYGVTDSIAITYLTDKVVAKLTANVQKFYHLNTENDLFAMDILYDNPQFSNAVAKHNGNISEVHWKSKSDEVYRGYTYFYDDIEQLTTAYYAEYNTIGGGWNSQINLYSVTNITHDHNGNIETLNRKGYRDDATYNLIDVLSYSYSGNQLITVDDFIQGVAITDDFDDNGSFGGTEFTYDANGNIITDANKGITISYNVLNLPEMITFTDGKQLHYMYSAKGTLLERQITQGMLSGVLHQYSGRFKYEDNVLTAITNADGRAVPDVSNGTDFRYEYNYTDQAGNVRLTFSDLNGNGLVNQDEIIQETHYYPFGGKLNGLNTVQIGPENHFKFNGNELHSDNGLNWYNFNARFYMPELGRFANVDPLAELAADWTPYRFAFNNPIALNDPTGLFEGYDYGDYGDYGDDYGDDDRDDEDRRRISPLRDYSWGCIECEQEDRGRDTYYDYDDDFAMEFDYDLLYAYDNGGDNGSGYDDGYDDVNMGYEVNLSTSDLPTKEEGGFIQSYSVFYEFMLDQAKNNPVEVAAFEIMDPNTNSIIYFVQPWFGNEKKLSYNYPEKIPGFSSNDITGQYHTHPSTNGLSRADAILSTRLGVPVHSIGIDGKVWRVQYPQGGVVPKLVGPYGIVID